MRRFTGSRTTALLFCVLLGTPLARAQSTAEIRGKVTDGSHQPVVSAFILVTGQDASLMSAATTDDAGEFELDSLPLKVGGMLFPVDHLRKNRYRYDSYKEAWSLLTETRRALLRRGTP
jgi:hypothetical protein